MCIFYVSYVILLCLRIEVGCWVSFGVCTYKGACVVSRLDSILGGNIEVCQIVITRMLVLSDQCPSSLPHHLLLDPF